MKKKGLTLEEHRQLGSQLKRLNDEMQDILVTLGRSYPVKDYETPILKAMHYMGRLRTRMEDKMFREHGDEASINIYYGPRKDD